MRRLFLYFFWFFPLFSTPPLEELSLEEKVGQLLLVHVRAETMTPAAKILLSKAHVGGIIYYTFANGLYNPGQVKTLSAALQNETKIPLFLSVDQEGGRVTHLKEGFSHLPSQREQALLNVGSLTMQMAKELREVGINLNFSPVVDVDSNPNNPIIGDRSFSRDPIEVIRCAKESITGYAKARILCCLKHFPGHGNSEVDSHLGLPTISKTMFELEKVELLPFYHLHNQVDLIMTGHLLVPALDPYLPATLSHKILTDLLRNSWGYQGAIISDSLIMKALATYGSLEEVALQAVLAGCDILCISGKIGNDEPSLEDYLDIHRFLVEAVQDGRLPIERLNEAVARILYLKNKYCP